MFNTREEREALASGLCLSACDYYINQQCTRSIIISLVQLKLMNKHQPVGSFYNTTAFI